MYSSLRAPPRHTIYLSQAEPAPYQYWHRRSRSTIKAHIPHSHSHSEAFRGAQPTPALFWGGPWGTTLHMVTCYRFGGAKPAVLAVIVAKVWTNPRFFCCASLQAKWRSSKRLRNRAFRAQRVLDSAATNNLGTRWTGMVNINNESRLRDR